jgi:UDP-N-acetylmuramate dehydrogenase
LAAHYQLAKNPQQLVAAVAELTRSRRPFVVLAGGSNIVFADKFYSGTVLHFVPATRGAKVDGVKVWAPANLKLATLIKVANKAGLGGLESLTDIPGTLGGALVGNAGAYGQTISDHLLRVEIWDGQQRRWLTRRACQFKYRHSIFKTRQAAKWLVLAAEFKLKPAAARLLRQTASRVRRARRQKYPPGLACPGSFFKNILWAELPPRARARVDASKVIEGKLPTGYLLEQVGAKGLRRGGVAIAEYHGNLLINEGEASYKDVRALAEELKKRVYQKFGIKLEEEVRYLGAV